MRDMRDLRKRIARHQKPVQLAETEARHAGEQMMLEMIVQTPRRDQP